MFTTTKKPLGRTVLRYAGVVQALVALPCMIQLVCSTYLYWSHPEIWYYFTTYTLAAGACGGIIFTAAVQWRALTTNFQVRRLEIVKSVLATGLFIWLNFSWEIGTPEGPFGHINLKRLIFSGLGVIVLFYGPLAYADAAWKDDERQKELDFEDDSRVAYTDAPEKAPLM